MSDEDKDDDSRQGIQSIEVGVPLLKTLAEHGAPMMLRDLARRAGMPPAKAHRYLVSFARTGLVSQEPDSGRYDLGHFALELGLASIARMDPVRVASPILEALGDQVGETVALAVWGNLGATIVRWVESRRPINVNLRTGSVMPLLSSAIGLCFATFSRSVNVHAKVAEALELNAKASAPLGPANSGEFEALVAEFRLKGMTRAVGSVLPGINAFCAPVFDHEGSMVLAIAGLGPDLLFSAEWDGPIPTAIRDAARTVSHRLGHSRQAG